jgi:WD40 repeat protein
MLLQDVPGEAVSFHPRRNEIWTIRNRAVTRWDLEQGAELARFAISSEPRRLEFSPDGECFATVHNAGANQLLSLYAATNGSLLFSWTFSDVVGDLRWHPAGKWIAVADHSGRVQLLDSETDEKKVLGAQKVEAVTLAFSPQGDYLISGGWEREMMCWDVRTRAPAFRIGIDSYHLQFSADGRRCGTLTRSTTPQNFFREFKLHAFEQPAGVRQFHEDLGSRLDQAAFSPDGRWLAASGRNHLGVWDLATNAPGALTDLNATARLFFTPDSSELIGSSRMGQWMRWRLRPGSGSGTFHTAPKIEPVALLNPAGFNSVCAVSNLIVWTCSKGSRLDACDRPDGAANWTQTAGGLNGISPDGRWLGVYRSFDTQLSIYRLPTLEPVATLTNRGSIYNFAFSPDGDEVAVGSRGQVVFWSTSTWRQTREMPELMDVLYTPDARTLWLTKDYRTAGLYDAATLELILPLPTGMLPLALSPDGRQLAVSVDLRKLQVWDLGEVRRQLARLNLDW